MDHSLGVKRPITSFRSGAHVSKRSRFMENGIKNMDAKVESQPSKIDKIKAMAQAPDLYSREADSGKTGVAAHTRKSSDSPAVVPIKKRRIQNLEAMRSPSPPPSLPSPKATSPCSIPQELSPPAGEIRSSAVSSTSSLHGFSSASSPRSSVPIPMSSSIPQARPLPILPMQPLACQGGIEKGEVENIDIAHVHKLDPKEQPTPNVKTCHDNEDNVSIHLGCIENVNGQVLRDADQSHSQVKLDGQLSRSESGSFCRDVRLHWDLNTDMEAWDASSEQIAVKICEGKDVEATPRSSSVDSAGTSQDHRNVGYDDDSREQPEGPDYGEEEPDAKAVVVEEDIEALEEVLEEPDTGEETGEQGVEEPEIGEEVVEDLEMEEQMEEEPDNAEQDFSGNSEHRDTEKEESTPLSDYRESGWNAPDVIDFPDSGKPSSLDADLSSEGREVHDLSETHCHHDDLLERPKPGKHGKSSSEDAEGWNYEPELEEHVDYGDSDCRDADDPGLELDERTSMMQEESNWKGEEGAWSLKVTPDEGEASIADEVFTLADAGQPSSEPSTDRHTPTGRSRTTGWDKLPEGFESAEDALRASKEGSARRGGRGGSWSSPAGRGSLHSASRFGPGTLRSNARDGFSAPRGANYYGDRHPDETMYDRDGYRHGRRADESFSSRGRDPVRRPGIFGRGRASGWVDSQPGHMNQWGPSRHRPGSGFSGPTNSVGASRVENGGFAVAPDGIGTKHGMGLGRGGIRSTVSGGRVGRGGHGRGPPVDMDGGVHYPLRPGAGADRVGGLGTGAGPSYSGGMHDRGGRGMMDRYRGGVMESRRSMSPRRPHPMDHPNMMGRMPGMRPDSRVVRSRTPPASHRSVGPSEFTTVRGQRSPPSARWSGDKRETDGYQDRDFKRPLSRTRVPPQRTSPHVVHGSSLTDERDRQVLAGSRHSPPMKGSIAPIHLRKSKDDILDPRAPKRNEEDDARFTGSFVKDGDYRRSSPTREIDREREKGSLYRRERDRDDERRRDTRRSTSRDGRFPGGPKYAGTREVDDDVAPRRRRPS